MESKIKSDSIYTTAQQMEARAELGKLFESSAFSALDKLGAFTKYITRQDLSLFLARYEIFKQVMEIKGSIIECGVYYGGGLMAYAQLSAALEPINYNRRIIGFDTFSGNAGVSVKDSPAKGAEGLNQASYAVDSEAELKKCIALYDANRFLNHIPKVELVRGDIRESLARYIENNPHLIVSLLELTVNLYEPTKAALKLLLPRIPQGGVIALNTLNEGIFPGVTEALMEEVGIRNACIKTFPYAPNLSYIVA